jgi:outer membrane receptor protein involved in Fe transport
VSDRLQVNLVGNYVRTDAENRNVTGYNNGNPMQAFTQWWQTQLDVDRLRENSTFADGTQMTWNAVGPQVDDMNNLLFFERAPNFFDNPYWVRDNYLQEDTRNRFFGNGSVTVNLAEGLDLIGRAGTDFYQFSLREGIPVQSVETSYYGETERRFQETNLEARLNYNKAFGRISLNATLGGNRMRQLQRRTTAQTTGGIALDGFFNISNSAGSPVIETNERNWGINSVFGVASIGFDNWLYMDVTARNDWSSTLPADANSYFYPSVSVSAVLSELPFLSGNSVLSFAKIRASYAQVGNDANPYSLFNTFGPQTPNFNGNPRYEVPLTLNNADLKPELTSEVEFGVDLRFFNGRLGIDAAYYDRTTENQIFTVPSSAATGYTARVLNAGSMRNYGVELQFTATPIQTKDFSMDVTINGLRQFNEVVELADGVESIARGGTWAADLRIAEGLPYMAVFGQDYVYDDDGNRLVDEDGWYQTTAERVFLGSGIADWTGGAGLAFNYKGIFVSGLVDFQVGGIIHSTSLQWAKYSGMHPETVSFNGIDDIRADGLLLPGVKEDGSENDIIITDPQTYYQATFGFAAPNVYDASFLKLRDLRVGYRLPNSIFGNTSFRDVTIQVYGRNLAILAADLPYLDPQIITSAGNDQGLENAQVPSTRSIGVNLNFKF